MEKVDTDDSQDALVFASVAVARVKLNLGQLDEARRDLDRAEKLLDSFDSVETVVHAAFYDANASYYQVLATADFTCRPQALTDLAAQNGLLQLLPYGAPISCLYRIVYHVRRGTAPASLLPKCSSFGVQ